MAATNWFGLVAEQYKAIEDNTFWVPHFFAWLTFAGAWLPITVAFFTVSMQTGSPATWYLEILFPLMSFLFFTFGAVQVVQFLGLLGKRSGLRAEFCYVILSLFT